MKITWKNNRFRYFDIVNNISQDPIITRLLGVDIKKQRVIKMFGEYSYYIEGF